MKIEKAIERMKSYKSVHVDDHFDLAIEALEKQIPKEPTEHGGNTQIPRWVCTSCGRMYWEKEHFGNYCDNCGQRIR